MSFNRERAKKKLISLEQEEKDLNEKMRLNILKKLLIELKDDFSGQELEIYLVGSIIQPYKFHKNSDVDIVVKNFKGDRFEIWNRLEDLLQRNVEIIFYEKCSFQEHVQKEGLRVI